MVKLNSLGIIRKTIPPEKISFLRFILEGYDGVGILSTEDSRAGKVIIRHPKETKNDLLALLDSLKI